MKNSAFLGRKLAIAIRTGDIPYQANRRALRAIGVQRDGMAGLGEIDLMLAGMDMLIDDLEELKRAATAVSARATSVIR